MSLTTEGAEKVARMKELSRKQFERLSVLSDAALMEDYDPSRQPSGAFIQLPYRPLMPIDDFNDPNLVMDLVFSEIGRGLAISETKYLTDRLAESGDSVIVEKSPIDALDDIRTTFLSNQHFPSIIFAPIGYYRDWYDDMMAHSLVNSAFFVGAHGSEKTLIRFPDGTMTRWVWSNRFQPFDDFYIVDKSWARWTSKRSQDDNARLQIIVNQVMDKLDVTFRLLFKFEVLNPDAVVRFTPKHVH